MNKTINIGDWIEITIGETVNTVKVLGFTEKGLKIYDEWNEFVAEWRDIDRIKVVN